MCISVCKQANLQKILKEKLVKQFRKVQRRATEDNQMSRKHDLWGKIKRTGITYLREGKLIGKCGSSVQEEVQKGS